MSTRFLKFHAGGGDHEECFVQPAYVIHIAKARFLAKNGEGFDTEREGTLLFVSLPGDHCAIWVQEDVATVAAAIERWYAEPVVKSGYLSGQST